MKSTEFSSFLDSISKYPLPVLDASIPLKHYISLDLSVQNSELGKLDVSSSETLANYINSYKVSKEAVVAFGGYNELRNIYQRSEHFNQMDPDSERNIHLGIDLWVEEGSSVYSPLDGTVHSFKNNQNFGDYGPTIILKHTIKDVVFYTLYGHLSLASIANLREGQLFLQGERIGSLGDASVNGDYPPHLHFQIIRDIGNALGDYPGVCSRKDLEFYLENCPDPNLLLKIL